MKEDEKKEKPGISRRGALAAAGAALTIGAGAAHAGGRKFRGRIGTTFAQSAPSFDERRTPPAKAPNILLIVLDDVGFSDLGCYGGEIATPEIDALAAKGLRYTNFRTTGVCSATRASLYTGLNPHSAGIGWLTFADAGYPGYRGDLTHEAATLAETLEAFNYATYHCGKWHVNADSSATSVGPFSNWPLQRGYQRAYWFQGHSTDYFRPSKIFDGNERVDAGGPNYLATDDFTDRAIRYIREHKAATDAPFFLSLAHAAAHSPLQAPYDDIAAQRGRYDAGWDDIRDKRLARQIEMGITPPGTRLPPHNPGVAAWADLSADERRLYARYMEIYAAVVSRVDAGVGRLVAALRDLEEFDNTLIMLISDNGGSPDGGLTGTPNLLSGFSGGVPLKDALAMIDILGGPDTYPMYPAGWAMASNTPFRLYKHTTHLGGVADPLIAHWPDAIAAGGETRRQYVHVCDIFPTLLDCVGAPVLRERGGARMKEIEGESFSSTFASSDAPEVRLEQHFEMSGRRALYADGWRLVSTGVFGWPEDAWELYNVREDFNETENLAAKLPDQVAALERRWTKAAHRYDVFPIDTRSVRLKAMAPLLKGGGRGRWDYAPPLGLIPEEGAPHLVGRAHTIEIELADALKADDQGVLFAFGNLFLGHVLYLQEGRLVHEIACAPRVLQTIGPAPRGARLITVTHGFQQRPRSGFIALSADGDEIARRDFDVLAFGMPKQGLQFGRNDAVPASHAFEAPFDFTGRIRRVAIDLDTSAFSEEEIAAIGYA